MSEDTHESLLRELVGIVWQEPQHPIGRACDVYKHDLAIWRGLVIAKAKIITQRAKRLLEEENE